MAERTVQDEAFGDRRAILVRPNDVECARVWREDDAAYEQSEDGPVLVVIGRAATDAGLSRLSERFPYSLEQLQQFRDGREAVPADLVTRFYAEEAPQFELMRAYGDVRLWRSQTKPHMRFDEPCSAKVHFHVTVAGEADLVLLPRLELALANFAQTCQTRFAAASGAEVPHA